MWPTVFYVFLMLLDLAFILRAILRPHRQPASRIAWVVVIAVLPIVGIVAYLLFGETSIGRKRIARAREVLSGIPLTAKPDPGDAHNLRPVFPERCEPLFRFGESINGFRPVGGNRACLTKDSNDAVDRIVADINGAEDHVHLAFYIWLADNNGLKVADALKRAARRGVTCRAMADSLGSRAMIGSGHWKDMEAAGVRVGIALPIGNPLLRPLHGRIDLRNHRKIVVIDDWITYVGSQNCADPEFRVKPNYAPWVDALMRFEGPIARQNQHVFAGDWMTYVDEDIRAMLE
ncbi:MAG: cardiolipin synthase, partial [Myxococcales bacterium]|nr:PLDc N-terminal domain-containing protein [Deltaproteobacteria bacterium]NNL25091.1 cardiolipin synthase [Myxococcales bacterium]